MFIKCFFRERINVKYQYGDSNISTSDRIQRTSKNVLYSLKTKVYDIIKKKKLTK